MAVTLMPEKLSRLRVLTVAIMRRRLACVLVCNSIWCLVDLGLLLVIVETVLPRALTVGPSILPLLMQQWLL